MDLAWQDWASNLCRAIASVHDDDLRKAAQVIASSKIVLTAGNGGSASLAAHAAQAILKPSYAAGGGRAAVCLTDGIPTLTAHANDGGWESALEEYARPFLPCTFLLISSSGKSKNIGRLAQLARDGGCPVIAFTGFLGGPLRDLATVSLHVDSDDYEVVEPAHDALLHRMQYHLRAL